MENWILINDVHFNIDQMIFFKWNDGFVSLMFSGCNELFEFHDHGKEIYKALLKAVGYSAMVENGSVEIL